MSNEERLFIKALDAVIGRVRARENVFREPHESRYEKKLKRTANYRPYNVNRGRF